VPSLAFPTAIVHPPLGVADKTQAAFACISPGRAGYPIPGEQT
jgi:hypothetical protein